MNSKSSRFNVALINTCTEAEGPFKRMAIWFQGCDLNCEGCCNPELKKFVTAHILSLNQIVKIASKSYMDNGIEGVTFLGGEPTLQKGLVDLCKALKEKNLGIILFTGKLFSQLDVDLKNSVDLIIDGNFDSTKIDKKRNMIGSTNQEIQCTSNRYLNETSWFFKKRNSITDINIGLSPIVTGDPVFYQSDLKNKKK